MHWFYLTAGRCYGPPASLGITSSGPCFLPSCFSPAAHPVTFSSPPCCRIPSHSVLSYRAYCSICLGKLSTYAGLPPVLDLPFMTALQVKKGDSWLQDSSSRSASAGWASGDYQTHNDNREPAFVSPYSYSFPTSHRFSAHHLKLFTKCPWCPPSVTAPTPNLPKHAL